MNARRPLSKVSGAPVTGISKLNAHLKALSLYGASLTLKVSVTRVKTAPPGGKVPRGKEDEKCQNETLYVNHAPDDSSANLTIRLKLRFTTPPDQDLGLKRCGMTLLLPGENGTQEREGTEIVPASQKSSCHEGTACLKVRA